MGIRREHKEHNSDYLDLGPEMFANPERTVISWAGDNFYKACGQFVSHTEQGNSTCVKPEGHKSMQHEDFDGRTKDVLDLGLDKMELEEAIMVAIGAASMTWEDLSKAGQFNSERAEVIGLQLMRRVRDAGPIYG